MYLYVCPVCARDEYEFQTTSSIVIGKSFYCEKDGSYSPIGCLGFSCYCQKASGEPADAVRVPLWSMHTLNCDKYVHIYLSLKEILIMCVNG